MALVLGLALVLAIAWMLVRDSKGKTAAPAAQMTGPSSLIDMSDRKRGPDWMQHNVGPELLVAYAPMPDNPLWRHITPENVLDYQLWFQRALLAGQLDALHSVASMPDETGHALSRIAVEAEAHGVRAAMLLVFAMQYIEADQVMRGLYATTWVAEMMREPDYAKGPGCYVDFVNGAFFSGK